MGKNVLKFPGDVLRNPSTFVWLLIAVIFFVGAMSVDSERVSMTSINTHQAKKINLSKVNISQSEFASKHREFFNLVEKNQRKRLRSSLNYDGENIVRKKLYTFTHSGLKNSPNGDVNLSYVLNIPQEKNRQFEVEDMSLRLMIVPKNCDKILDSVTLTVGRTNKAYPSHQEEFHLASCFPRWIGINLREDFPTTENYEINIRCKECLEHGIGLSDPYLNVIVKEKNRVRSRRAGRKRKRWPGRCSRHEWKVDFSTIPGFAHIVEPRIFDAGLCLGKCKNLKHFATQHSHIQYLLSLKNDSIPWPCCAPSKMEPLEVMYFDEDDSTKLKINYWNDSKVAECACI